MFIYKKGFNISMSIIFKTQSLHPGCDRAVLSCHLFFYFQHDASSCERHPALSDMNVSMKKLIESLSFHINDWLQL